MPPVINDAGEIVFRARSASSLNINNLVAIGIYAKRPGFPLARLVDTTEISPGVPTFPVPGRPAGTRFTDFTAPILTNSGYVVFRANFSPGPPGNIGFGIFATTIAGGPIVNVVDNFTTVPSQPTGTFNNFTSPVTGLVPIVVNDAGQIAYWGNFLLSGNPTMFNGIFGTSVAGGAGIRIADSTQTVSPVLPPGFSPGAFRELRSGLAINSAGMVAFKGSIGPSPSFRGGIFVAPVTGGTIDTVAFQGQPVPGRAATFTGTFSTDDNAIDINDAGVVVFSNQFSSGTEFGHYSATPLSGGGYLHARISDTLGGIPIPGEVVPPAEFSGSSFPPVNNLGQVAFYSFVINTTPPPPPGISPQGFYATDADGTPISLVANMFTPPPGLSPPVSGFPRFSNFLQESCTINDSANLAFVANGNLTSSTAFVGAYFYDSCTPELVRLSDSTISSAQLGSPFSGSGINKYDIWQLQSRNGHYRSLNETNDVAFLAVFSNLEFGIYIAHVALDGGGQVAITCPADATVECGGSTDPGATGDATATGCGTVTVSFTDSSTPGCGGSETITRTWTASNGSSSTTCTQMISIVDTTGPVFSGVPDSISVECNAVPDPQAPTAFDECDGAAATITFSETQASGACPNAYLITRTWTATDQCGNTSTATQMIAVGDTTPPALVGVPSDVTAECDAVPAAPNVTALDNCDGAATVSFQELRVDGSCPGSYTLSRTWTTTDACGNSASATQIVTVQDTTDPVLSGVPMDASAECDAVPSPATVTASDNCDPSVNVTMIETRLEGTCLDQYTLTREWTAVDDCGNLVSALQVIAVDDTVDPVLVGVPADTSAECDAVPPPANVTATDNCDLVVEVSLTESEVAGDCPDESTLTRTWTANDNCGHSVSDAQIISILDTTPPVIACPADATLECPADFGIAANGSASASDNCGAATIASSDATAAGCGATETVTRTWSATDECGNSSSCQQVLSEVDTTPPLLTVDTTPITATDVDCSGSEAVSLPAATATDACDASVAVSNNAPALFPAGETTLVTFTATDDCGNSDLADISVTVKHGANLAIRAERHYVQTGPYPPTSKEPLVGILVCAYDKTVTSCANTVCGGISHQQYQCIIDQCEPQGCCTTDSSGECTMDLPTGNYVAISGDATKTVLPDPLGVSVGDVSCGQTRQKYLQQIVRADGSRKSAKYTILTGSMLLVIEPEFIVWDNTVQLYPFVFESIGDWEVTATVVPPEGFVADYEQLTAEVNSELEAVQFTITEVGSDLVPTKTEFLIKHKGKTTRIKSEIDIKLTKAYAKARGFDLATLRQKGLLVEETPVQPPRSPNARAGK